MPGPTTKIDWDRLELEIRTDDEPNPQNPTSSLTPEQREQAVRELARRILFRAADQRVTSKN